MFKNFSSTSTSKILILWWIVKGLLIRAFSRTLTHEREPESQAEEEKSIKPWRDGARSNESISRSGRFFRCFFSHAYFFGIINGLKNIIYRETFNVCMHEFSNEKKFEWKTISYRRRNMRIAWREMQGFWGKSDFERRRGNLTIHSFIQSKRLYKLCLRRLSLSLSIYLSIYLSINLSIYLSIYLSVSFSIYLSIFSSLLSLSLSLFNFRPLLFMINYE